MPLRPGRQPDARFGARALVALAAIASVAVLFGLLLFLVEDRWSPLLALDTSARDDLHALAVRHHGLVSALETLSTLGSAVVYVPLFAAVAAWLAWRRLPRLACFVVVTTAGSSLLNALVKQAVDRARPVLPDPVAHASGLSFPSGHAQSAFVAAAVLLLVFMPLLRGWARPAAVALALVWVLAIGFARVTLGVHYVSDVLAGYLLGAVWVATMIVVFNAWRTERGRPAADPARGLEPAHGGRLGPGAPLERDP
jgi:membrane-associated phospholipid phosphatase